MRFVIVACHRLSYISLIECQFRIIADVTTCFRFRLPTAVRPSDSGASRVQWPCSVITIHNSRRFRSLITVDSVAKQEVRTLVIIFYIVCPFEKEKRTN